ncbi:MAG TPA: hypothetical protein VF520_12755 [Thermoleophilaceae bacterium]|jgi:hypothetical protein
MQAAIAAYDPPGFMPDFEGIPGQLEQWSTAVSGWFDGVIASEAGQLGGQPCQYYNQLEDPPAGLTLEQEIVWNGFPGTLRNRWGRAQALELADTMIPLTQRIDGPGSYNVGPQWEHLYYRPQDEYCEWHVTRDAEGRIQRVTFVSEPPEYWQAMHGDTLPDGSGQPTFEFKGDPDLLLSLYRELVSEDVQLDDLVCAEDLVDHRDPSNPQVVYPKGSYNPYNHWNTTDGIVHLTQPANSLQAEIQLGGDATILYQRGGRRIADPDALICCAAYGGPNRCSDPTIGASVNELAALGCAITLRNPVGLYMDRLDMTGWTKPDGSPVEQEYFQVVRGRPGLIERAVFEVPAEEGFAVSDVRIGGVPIVHGGQLAEHMTVKLVGLASDIGKFSNSPAACRGSCCVDDANPDFLRYAGGGGCPTGYTPAFAYPEPITPGLAAAAPPPAAATQPIAKHRTRTA